MRRTRGIGKKRRIESRWKSEKGSGGSTPFFAPGGGQPEHIFHLHQSNFQRINLAEHGGQEGPEKEGDDEGHQDGRHVKLGGEGGRETASVERLL